MASHHDPRVLHEMANRVRPDKDLIGDRYLIAILFHHHAGPHVQQDSFMWLISNGALELSKASQQYHQRHEGVYFFTTGSADIALSPTFTMGLLNEYGDNLITLRAIDSAKQPPRHHILPRGAIGSDPSPTSRNPLQPTNRQSAAPEQSEGTVQKPKPVSSSMAEDLSVFPLQTPPKTGPTPQPSDKLKSEGRTPSPRIQDTAVEETNTNTLTEPAEDLPEPTINLDLRIGPSPGHEQREEEKSKYLDQVMAATSAEDSEKGVEVAVQAIDHLKTVLQLHPGFEGCRHWIELIDQFSTQRGKSRTVLGVVGNTGAGKSSVINALLDEERLVPTNCMRACTAVVTELSWNENDDHNHLYRAEIEFIKHEDWEKELQILFKDLLDSNGEVSRDCTNPDSEAGIAYAKIKAVYPRKTREDLAKSSIACLLDEQGVRKVLGTTIKINNSACDSFYHALQKYVDSQEKSTGQEKRSTPRVMEFWPLIKVVKIYTKAPVLATGAVLVDLPGVHDSNAARAAVAEGYMKECTGLWIVAPINRAVDDKAAKNLLGETFKRQMKYDGMYNAVTFICSKTDDISITEASESLKLDIDDSQCHLDESERQGQRLKSQLQELREQKATHNDTIDALDDLIDAWEDLRTKAEDGETVYAPKEVSKKRKHSDPPQRHRKRKRQARSNGSSAHEDSEDEPQPEDSDLEEIYMGDPLTVEQIAESIEIWRDEKRAHRKQRGEIEERMRTVRKSLDEIKQVQASLKSGIYALCITGRNDYSKGAIRQDFAAGIRELDQENQVEEDEANFDPEQDLRDYDEVARSLPVFCISSRAYQKLCGRFKKEAMVPGFTDIDQTEIPQLQAHCKKLTESGRQLYSRRYLNGFSQLLNSIGLWASANSATHFSDSQRAADALFLQGCLNDLEKAFDKITSSSANGIKKILSDYLYDGYADAVQQAQDQARSTAEGWGAHRSQGGLHWSTYKAAVRREGVFSGTCGQHDFNQELVDPMKKALATNWERAFQSRVPQAVEQHVQLYPTTLKDFHETILKRVGNDASRSAGLNMLANQLRTYESTFNDISSESLAVIMEYQRNASREFTPVIANAMHLAYHICTVESGKGATYHVHNAAQAVKDLLEEMCKQVRQLADSSVFDLLRSIERDYQHVLGGSVAHTTNIHEDPVHRALLQDIRGALDEVNGSFKPLVFNGDISSPPVDENSDSTPYDAAATRDEPEDTSPASDAASPVVSTPTRIKLENEYTIPFSPNKGKP